MTYDITISVDVGAALPPVNDLLKELNAGLSMFGMEEKLSLRSELIAARLTSKRELTEKEIETVKQVIASEFNAGQPAWKAKVESFRRQSGNVQQSAV